MVKASCTAQYLLLQNVPGKEEQQIKILDQCHAVLSPGAGLLAGGVPELHFQPASVRANQERCEMYVLLHEKMYGLT